MTSNPSERNSDFSLRLVYEGLIRKWKWVALWVIIGALAGWGISSLRRPLFESRSVFTFNIDYTQSGALTDVEEDQALEAAGDLLKSTPVKQATLAELAAAGIQLTEPDLKDSLFIERRNTDWLVIARRPDANEAAAIANAWSENFDRAYQEAYGHALKADGLQRYLKSLESCLGETVAIEPVQAACGLSDLAAVQAELAKTGEEIRLERLAGKTLFAGTLYEWSGRAEVSTSPVWYDRNKFLLLGALIGLVFSLWFIEAPFMQKKVE